MIPWQIQPARPHLALSVRVGTRGALVPLTRGSVTAGDVQLVGHTCAVRYPLTAAPLTVRLSMRDLASVAPRDGRVHLTATLYHAQGITTHTLTVQVTNDAPDGLVYALITPDGTYFTAEGLESAVSLTVTCENGAQYSCPAPGSGVTLADGRTGTPIAVTATDDEGRESGDVLASVEREPIRDDSSTLFSPWPLPPYLNPDAPNLRAFLSAMESTLDVQPDNAGDALRLHLAGREALTYLASHYGVTRVDAPTDGEMTRRVQATLTRFKASRAGLTAMLRAHGIFGAQVHDLFSLSGGRSLMFDGTWNFDGSKNFDGGARGYTVQAGEILAVFSRPPARGLDAALRVLRRYKAAGMHTRVLLRQRAYAELPTPGLQVRLRARATFPTIRGRSRQEPLNFDGSWNFDGSENFDGVKSTPPAPGQ